MDRPDRRFALFAGWVAFHLLAYVTVAISIRFLSTYFQIIEIAALRSVGSLLIAGGILLRFPTRNKPDGVKLFDDVKRSLLHLVGSLALVWSVVNLPLAFVATVEFAGPLFAALIGWLLTHHRPHRLSGGGLAMIAAGSVILLFQQGVAKDIRLFLPVVAVFILTVTNLMLANLARTRRVTSIIFVMHAIQFPAYLVILTILSPGWFAALAAKAAGWTPTDWTSIALAGSALTIAGFVTQAALANASRHGSALQLCAADVLRLPLIAAVGFLVFAEPLGMALVIPGVIIVIGSIVASAPGGGKRRDEAGGG